MPKPSVVLLVLVSLSVGAAGWLRPRPDIPPTAATPATLVHVDERALKAEKQAEELSARVKELQSQLKSMREENSGLIDKLASLGLQMQMEKASRPQTPETPDSPPDFVSLAIELMTQRDIREPPAPVIPATMTELEQLILAQLRKQFPGDFGKREGAAFAALGLIPEAIDTVPLRAAYLARLIGAWYDDAEGTIRMADPKSGSDDTPVLIEPPLALSYAVLLRQFGKAVCTPNTASLCTDERLARNALLGGDAALLRFLRELKLQQQSRPAELPTDDPDHPLNQIPFPAFLRELELFPQVQGFRFAQSLHSIGGFAQLSAAYGRMPVATADVIDTERYLNKDKLPVPRIEFQETAVNNAAPFWDDRLGQAAITIMLKRFNEPQAAIDAARGWESDRLLTWHAPKSIDERGHVVWQTRWSSPAGAEKFFEAMREWLAQFYRAPIDKLGSSVVKARTRSLELVRLPDRVSVLLIDAADADFAAAAHRTFLQP